MLAGFVRLLCMPWPCAYAGREDGEKKVMGGLII